jgi:uncharacterized protein (UPF0332 family)
MKEATQKLLTKAHESIKAAEILTRERQHTFAASRAYYAMFYVAEALLYEQGLKFKKHSSVQSAFGEQYVKPGTFDAKFHKAFVRAFENRLISDYDIDAAIPPEAVQVMIEEAAESLQVGGTTSFFDYRKIKIFKFPDTAKTDKGLS